MPPTKQNKWITCWLLVCFHESWKNVVWYDKYLRKIHFGISVRINHFFRHIRLWDSWFKQINVDLPLLRDDNEVMILLVHENRKLKRLTLGERLATVVDRWGFKMLCIRTWKGRWAEWGSQGELLRRGQTLYILNDKKHPLTLQSKNSIFESILLLLKINFRPDFLQHWSPTLVLSTAYEIQTKPNADLSEIPK